MVTSDTLKTKKALDAMLIEQIGCLKNVSEIHTDVSPHIPVSSTTVDIASDINNILTTIQASLFSIIETNPEIKDLLVTVRKYGRAISNIIEEHRAQIEDFVEVVNELKGKGMTQDEIFNLISANFNKTQSLNDQGFFDEKIQIKTDSPSKDQLYDFRNIILDPNMDYDQKVRLLSIKFLGTLSGPSQTIVFLLIMLFRSLYYDIGVPIAVQGGVIALPYVIESYMEDNSLKNLREIAIDEVSIRYSASPESEEKTILKKGVDVRLLETKDGWSHIKWQTTSNDTLNGWVEDSSISSILLPPK